MNKTKLGVLLVVCLVAISTAAAMTVAEEKKENINTLDTIRGANPDDNQYVPYEIIVKFKPGVKGNEISKINSKHKTEVLSTSQYADFKRLKIAKGKSVPEMVEIYSKNPNVEYAEPNYIAHALMVPNDPYYNPYQWHLNNPVYGGINMESAWEVSTGTDVIVAIIDTGVAYEDHEEFVDLPGRRRDYWITYAQAPDLAGTTFVPGYDFVNNDAHPNDDEGHGTHVTGTIAQTTNNNYGVAGVAFNARIMPVKVLDSGGSGSYDWIVDGIYFAVDNGAQVISMSLGGTLPSTTLEDALAYAHGKGITIVCSAGNGGADGPRNYPAAYDAYCIAVGATRYDEAVSYYSTTGDYVDITAPGGDIYIDQNGDGYGDGILQQTHDGSDYTNFGYYFYQGTSMATPHVSGVAALILQKNPTWTPADVREALEKTAEDKGDPERDPEYGWGIVDAYAAVTYTPSCTSSDDCDDGLYCNGDEICDEAGVCKSGIPVDCSDTLLCTIDSCDEVNDMCLNTPDDSYCDDGVYCNGVEKCDAIMDCQDGTPVNCNDNNECTRDICNEGTAACENTPQIDGISCIDGVCCSGECMIGAEECPTSGCGNDVCEGNFEGQLNGEDCRTCPEDCGALPRGVCCGDGKCDIRKGEDSVFCPVDCGSS